MYLGLSKRLQNLQDRFENFCDQPYFIWLMGLLFFTESIFFPIPIDPLLAIACLKRPAKALYYGIFATVTSVLGGIAAYGIGALLWQSLGLRLIHLFSSETAFEMVCQNLRTYEAWAVLIGGFTPFPYKAVAILTGFCRIPILPFIIFSIISRGMRFILIALLVRRYGIKVKYYLDHYGTILILLFMLISFISFSCLK